MLLFNSSLVGLKCQTEPYSFSGAKPAEAMVWRTSVHLTSPGVLLMSGVKNIALKTLEARSSTSNTGRSSCTSWSVAC